MEMLFRKKELRVVGIMNGTSLDGIDFVLTQISRKKGKIGISFLAQKSSLFPAEMKSRLARATQHLLKVEELALLHHDLGRLYANELSKIKTWKFDLIGLHGQTVFHRAPQATLQIGEASYMAADLRVPVVADFRVADLAVGGQGAPIASLFHKIAFADQIKDSRVSIHNLGGISNLTSINQGKVQKSFDTGPANMLIDLLICRLSKGKKNYDKDGAWASRGQVCNETIEKIISEHEYFQKPPPKSCGREEFGEKFLKQFLKLLKGKSKEDQLATVTDLTAQSIAHAYRHHLKMPPKKIILCGGGAKNKYLVSRIQFHLPPIKVITTESLAWPVEAIEGGAFALLAAYRIWNLPANLPKTTGAKRAVRLGKITDL